MLALAPSCVLLRPARGPLDSLEEQRTPRQRAPCLVVMLPGYGDSAVSFRYYGFVDAVRGAGLDADIVAVDAHYGYYRRGTVAERLHEDVLAPARESGYARVVLVAISIGGLGAVGTARLYPEDVDELFLLAPYLGDGQLGRRLQRVGLMGFRPAQPDDFMEQNWTWLRGYVEHEPRPPLHLGYGEDDVFAPMLAVLGSNLPDERLITRPGTHAWATWTPIFDEWIRRGDLERACRCE